MWSPIVKLAFGLSVAAQTVSSNTILSRQAQCDPVTGDAAQAACAMKAAFGGSSVIPQLFDDFSPKAALSVKYGDVVIGGAQQMSPAKVSSPPLLSLSFISNNSQALKKAYVILGLQYQPQSKGMQLFWLQSSVNVDATTGLMTSSLQPIVKYKSPNPPSGSGTNEYIFFVFQDPGLENLFKQNPQMGSITSGALDFKGFMKNANLSNQLIAGSYFKSSFDGLAVQGQNTPSSFPTQARQLPQSSSVTGRVADNSRITEPGAPAQSQSLNPTVPVATSPSTSQSVSTTTQSTNSTENDVGQNETPSSSADHKSHFFMTSFIAVATLGASLF